MPSSDQSIAMYTECLDTVDAIISRITPKVPIIVLGDLNCHLGCLGGVRSNNEPNDRRVLWKNIIDRHSLFVVSMGALVSGPVHNISGQSSTTLDYIVGNTASTSFLQSCTILEDHPLNTSDPFQSLQSTLFQLIQSSPRWQALNALAGITQHVTDPRRFMLGVLMKQYYHY